MQLLIKMRNLESDKSTLQRGLRDSVEERVRFALSRFGDRIARTEVILSDVNGPRGGNDQRCVLKVFMPSTEPLIIDTTENSPLAAVGRACDRAVRRVRDQHVRRRDLQRNRSIVDELSLEEKVA